MKVLVTGAQGKVGHAATAALAEAGHEVTASDVGRGVFERPLPGEPAYQQADLTEAGQAFAIVHGHDAVVHPPFRTRRTTHPTSCSRTT
ncbi:NAD-dependent epimerase/dehydratase family protein [Pseudonocardia sp. Cha107L01]|uniref:NAD-dependent epimerase/dehydratase family protein n=1 Tax=Pseudonocardia sp. Cha107L01 TaxID=3457576 RepID=UPI00403E67A8